MLFERTSGYDTAEKRRLFAIFEIVYTLIDFMAAAFFVVGSIFFFYKDLTYSGTWLFLIGSLLFAAKPTIRLVRELKMAAMGDKTDLAQRFKE